MMEKARSSAVYRGFHVLGRVVSVALFRAIGGFLHLDYLVDVALDKQAAQAERCFTT